MALTDNIVSYWKFNESSGNASDSVGSNTLTNENTATFTTGILGNGCSLTSSSSQDFTITDASQSGLDLTGDFTLAGWINPTTLTRYNSLVTKTDGGSATQINYIFILDNANKLTLDLSDNGGQAGGHFVRWAQSTANITTTGTWYHVGVTFTAASSTTTMYVNGSSVTSAITFGTTIGTTLFNGTGPFRIGDTGGYWAANDFMDGKMDEWGVWNRALSSGEMSQLYNGGVGLTYPFTSASATVFNPTLLTLNVG